MSTIGATDSGPDRSVPALTIVSSLNFDLPETVTHKVFVIGEFVADCSLRASNFVVGDIQVDGKTFLNTRVNNLNGAIGETVVVSGVLTVPPGTHNFALRAFTDAANLFARHPTLSVVDLNRSEGALSVKWFGAKGDGQTDDTDAIIAATKAAAAIPAFNDVQQPAGVVTFANGGKYKCLKTMSFDMLANVVWRGPAQIDFQGLALVSMQGPPPGGSRESVDARQSRRNGQRWTKDLQENCG
jgi:hypothetical protein